MFPQPRNPILDEIDNAHASLSPPAQKAIALSGVPAGFSYQQAQASAIPGANPQPASVRQDFQITYPQTEARISPHRYRRRRG